MTRDRAECPWVAAAPSFDVAGFGPVWWEVRGGGRSPPCGGRPKARRRYRPSSTASWWDQQGMSRGSEGEERRRVRIGDRSPRRETSNSTTLETGMSIVHFITHPEVVIDPAMPVPDWPLSPVGRERMRRAVLEQPWLRDVRALFSSAERKARDAASIIAEHLCLQPAVIEDLGENDRSATGYLPRREFEAVADEFFARPRAERAGLGTCGGCAMPDCGCCRTRHCAGTSRR